MKALGVSPQLLHLNVLGVRQGHCCFKKLITYSYCGSLQTKTEKVTLQNLSLRVNLHLQFFQESF